MDACREDEWPSQVRRFAGRPATRTTPIVRERNGAMDERPTIETASGPVTLIRDAAIADIEAYEIDCGLSSIMRSATVRRRVLRELAADPHARLTLAVAAGAVVGHLGIGPSFGRWRVLPRVREIAFEVSRGWRQSGLVSAMIRRAMADPAIEDEIIVGFLWPAAWDLAELAGSRIAYRDMLMRIAARVGFQAYGT